jgi:hypothetical protein
MVRAILAGTKTQTRRIIIDPQPVFDGELWHVLYPGKDGGGHGLYETEAEMLAEYVPWVLNHGPQVGDRLWAKETFAAGGAFARFKTGRVQYRADYADGRNPSGLKWKPSIFMPRWASRITCDVTNVRVQRLQDISEDDAAAEGVSACDCAPPNSHRCSFNSLWNDINGPESWDANPYVRALTFTRVEVPHV